MYEDNELEKQQTVLRLRAAIQNYDWGLRGLNSTVAYLGKCNNPDLKIEPQLPYAELWVGTHVKGPAMIWYTKRTLGDWLLENQSAYGQKVLENFPKLVEQGHLPFLLKVLSIQKALSIQIHPNKDQAKLLHRKDPINYPDPNHKPEMVIALSEFEGLVGFKPKKDILRFLKSIDELREVIGDDVIGDFEKSTTDFEDRGCLKECFVRLMSADAHFVSQQILAVVTHVYMMKGERQDVSAILGDLLVKLNSQFPGDVGCFCIYFLNHVTLQPGQAMFLKANVPHAYLSGDVVECMACSDNVIRAGLTPKFKDVNVLCSLLDYTMLHSEDMSALLFTPTVDPQTPHITTFCPDELDFAINKITLPADVSLFTLEAMESCSILLVVSATGFVSVKSGDYQGMKVTDGTVLFIRAYQTLYLTITESANTMMYRAYCNILDQ